MEQKLNEVLLSAAKEIWSGLDKKRQEIIFVIDKNFEGKEKPDCILFGIGFKGQTRINSRELIEFSLSLINHEDYKYLNAGSSAVFVVKDGFGIIYFISTVSNWNFYMRDQENSWQKTDLFGKKGGFPSRCLSWFSNITTTQVMTLILFMNTLIFVLFGLFLVNKIF